MGQPGLAVHDFREQLKYSEFSSDESFWEAAYKKAFPNMVNHMIASGNTQSQRMGIDRVIILANGQVIKIDEKKRKEDHNDILLEYISVDATNAPGWMEKDLAIDYLAYAFMPSKKVFLFPWPLLRKTWLENKNIWLAENKYQKVWAQNNGYKTWSVAIPTLELRQKISLSSIIAL